MGIFSHHESCLKCGSRDNRAVYTDGGSWCFGCGASAPSSVSGFVREQEHEEKTWSLPDDLTQDFPEQVVAYALQYRIGVSALIREGYFYSGRMSRLFRLFNSSFHNNNAERVFNSICAAEGRFIHGTLSTRSRSLSSTRYSRPPIKSLFYGSKETIFAKTGNERPSRHLCLTEDSFSSIRVGELIHSMPLFGTSISQSKLTEAVRGYERLSVWLDHDKFKEGWEIAMKAKWLGLSTNVILTALDPKCYSKQEIMEYLK